MFDTPTRRAMLLAGAGTLALGSYGYVTFARPTLPEGAQALEVGRAHREAAQGSLLLVDIRRPDEWQRTGTPEHGHPIDMRRDDFVATLDHLVDGDRTTPVALICARGVRSARMSAHLVAAGFTRVIDVPEGMLGSTAGPGWLRAGLPVVRP